MVYRRTTGPCEPVLQQSSTSNGISTSSSRLQSDGSHCLFSVLQGDGCNEIPKVRSGEALENGHSHYASGQVKARPTVAT